MSYENGMAAMNLEYGDCVPRTEYSAASHWKLVSAVTGIRVDEHSSPETQERASGAFLREWDYGMDWNIKLHSWIFGQLRTSMGHAAYAAGAVDLDTDTRCSFRTTEEVLSFDPVAAFGVPDRKEWKRLFEEDYRAHIAHCPDTVNMTGIYITCMSGLIDLLGWNMLLASAGEDPVRFGEMTDRYAAWIRPYFEALAEADVPVVMVHDDIVWSEGPFIRPAWYRKYVFPHYREFFAPLRDSGKKILFTSDGNYTMFIDDVAAAGAHGFVLEPLTDLAYVAGKYGKTHVIVGNADTRVLLGGSREEIYGEVKRCMDTAKDCPGFIMAVGNHIPPNTPVESALWYDECYRRLRKR